MREVINTTVVSTSSTNTTTRTYKALLSQSGNLAPTAYIIQNNFAVNPTWSYIRTGGYNCTFNQTNNSGIFITGRIWTQPPVYNTGIYPTGSLWSGNVFFTKLNNNVLQLNSPMGNNVLNFTPIEITAYPGSVVTTSITTINLGQEGGLGQGGGSTEDS